MDEKRTASNTAAEQRDIQKQAACVAGDIDAVARYWAIRKQELLADAAGTFISFVEPAFLYDMPPFIEPDSFNVMFTEWMLFEYPFRNGRTPLEEYAAHPPAGAKALHLDHVRQICETQIFSRFIIHDKDTCSGMAALEDIQTARRYDVYDPELCKRARWRSGTIGERIACVDELSGSPSQHQALRPRRTCRHRPRWARVLPSRRPRAQARGGARFVLPAPRPRYHRHRRKIPTHCNHSARRGATHASTP